MVCHLEVNVQFICTSTEGSHSIPETVNMTTVIQTENAMWLQKGKPIYKVLRHTTAIPSTCQGQQES